jgi:hypothetical protein
LRDRGRSNCARGETNASHFQKFTTFHALPPPFLCRCFDEGGDLECRFSVSPIADAETGT